MIESNIDELTNELEKLHDETKKQKDKLSNGISLDELFTQNFMKKYTKFSNINDFFDNSPFDIKNQSDFDNLDEDKLDKYINNETTFSNWQDFAGKAAEILL